MRGKPQGFLIRPVPVFAAVARVHNHRGRQGVGLAVMPIEQIRPFVGVAVAAEHHVHPIALQNRQRVLTHLDEFGFFVRIVRALAVGRMVPEGNAPVLLGSRQVRL